MHNCSESVKRVQIELTCLILGEKVGPVHLHGLQHTAAQAGTQDDCAKLLSEVMTLS
jgi:hypothetical protein